MQSVNVFVVEDKYSALGREQLHVVELFCFLAANALCGGFSYPHEWHFVDPGDAHPLPTQQSAMQQLSLPQLPKESPQGPYLDLQNGSSARTSGPPTSYMSC